MTLSSLLLMIRPTFQSKLFVSYRHVVYFVLNWRVFFGVRALIFTVKYSENVGTLRFLPGRRFCSAKNNVDLN
jgi:hypothetical protein